MSSVSNNRELAFPRDATFSCINDFILEGSSFDAQSITEGANKPLVIGILGGMGSAATAHMYSRLVTKSQERGARTDQAFPSVMMTSIPTAGTHQHGWDNDNLTAKTALDHIQILVDAGASFILPACNTISLLLGPLVNKISVPVLSLPDIAAASLRDRGYTKVAVACSATASKADLHVRALQRQSISVESFTHDEQQIVDELIKELIGCPASDKHRSQLQSLATSLMSRGAQTLLLGCTELSLVTTNLPDSVEFALDYVLDILNDAKKLPSSYVTQQGPKPYLSPMTDFCKEPLCA